MLTLLLGGCSLFDEKKEKPELSEQEYYNQARKALDFGVGVNWYLSRFYKVMVNYDFTRFDGGAPNGGDREDEHVLMTRLQLAM